MNDTATVLVAAFGGGLVGSVLQPIVEYLLSRLRANDEVRKQFERRLRQMIEEEIGFVRRLLHMVAIDTLRVEHGEMIDPETWSKVLQPGGGVWRPKRIADPALRKMAIELEHLPLRFVIETAEGKGVLETLPIIEGRRGELQDMIFGRMDELHWPEAE